MKEYKTGEILKPNSKVALYARVSTGRQEKEKTIDSQIAELRKYCHKEKYIVHKVYKDNGYSGNLLERPGLDKLRDDAQLRKFDAVICLDLDRLARNAMYRAVTTYELHRFSIPIVFLTNPKITGFPEERFLENLQSIVAEYELKKRGERMRFSQKTKKVQK